jgi:AMP nucleosidase
MTENPLDPFAMGRFLEVDPYEKKIAKDTLERYSGSHAELFGSCLLITNFASYVSYFSELFNVPLIEGSMFTCAHVPELDLSIID